ncbi:hypothetical protein ACLOJK_039623 [Asimina triloba]
MRNVTDPDTFNQLLGQLMKGLVSTAVSDPPDSPLYATNATNFTSFRTIHGLVQCTNNLLVNVCSSCLEEAIAQIPVCRDGIRGGRVIGPDCNIRFELYLFCEDSAATAAPAPFLLDPLYTECQNETALYRTDDAFGTNLKSLLDSLASKVAVTSFSMSDMGENSNQIVDYDKCIFECCGNILPSMVTGALGRSLERPRSTRGKQSAKVCSWTAASNLNQGMISFASPGAREVTWTDAVHSRSVRRGLPPVSHQLKR